MTPLGTRLRKYLDHLHSVALQARPLSIASSISVNAAHNTGNGRSGSVEAHGVGYISPNDHEGLVLIGEKPGTSACIGQQAVLPTQLGIDLQHQVATVLLTLARVGWEAVICNRNSNHADSYNHNMHISRPLGRSRSINGSIVLACASENAISATIAQCCQRQSLV